MKPLTFTLALSSCLLISSTQALEACDPELMISYQYFDDQCTEHDYELDKQVGIIPPEQYAMYSGECYDYPEKYEGEYISLVILCGSEGLYETVYLGYGCQEEMETYLVQWGECTYHEGLDTWFICETAQEFGE